MPEPLLERLRREEARKAALTAEEKVEEYFMSRTDMLALELFGTGELDPFVLFKDDPQVLVKLLPHFLWDVTDFLDDTLERSKSAEDDAEADPKAISAHNTLVFGKELLADAGMQMPDHLQRYLEKNPDRKKRKRGRPPLTEAQRSIYLDLIRFTRDTLGVYATRNAASVGVVSACDHIEAIAQKRGLSLGYKYSNLSRIWEERKKSR